MKQPTTTRIQNRTSIENTFINEGPNETEYRYDLNSKPVFRQYSSGVEELRTFDPMGRLLTMTTTIWGYDYRSTPSTPHMVVVFDGGLSIQEYKTESKFSNLSSQSPSTEFIRGEGMGGGVGGMVYSIKHPEPNAQSPALSARTPTIVVTSSPAVI